MMGEFLPIVYVALKHAPTTVHLCKPPAKRVFPLNSFYQEVARAFGFRIHISSAKVDGRTYVTPTRWDWSFHGEQHKLRWVVQQLKSWAGQRLGRLPLVLVQDRRNTASLNTYYTTNDIDARRQQYGENRRRVTNLRAVVSALKRAGQNAQYTVPDGTTLRAQIQKYAQANRLVLGHGAGMVHILWMRPHSQVVEIIPEKQLREDNGAVQGCKRLCGLCGFHLHRIPVSDQHCAVGVDEVARCITTRAAKNPTRTRKRNPRR